MVTFEFGKAKQTTLDTNSIFIRFKGSDFKENVNRIKGFWNRKYIVDDKCWEVPFSCLEEIKKLYKDTDIEYINEPPKAKTIDTDDILQGMDFNGLQLYDYQLDAVKFGLNHHNFLLLDEQGLGKTLVCLTIARYRKMHNNMKHCLVVCGVNSLKYNWIKEIEKFCPDEKGVILGTRVNRNNRIVSISVEETKEQLKNEPNEFFWIINIEKLRLDKQEYEEGNSIINILNDYIKEEKLGMVVIDEIHNCKSESSQSAQGLLHLDKTVNFMGMTGTILVNNPYDLYVPMKLCGLINDTKWQYENKYVIKNPIYHAVEGYKNIDQLHDILYKSSLRRTKDILDLPPKLYKEEWLEPSDEEEQLINSLMGNGKFLFDKIEPPTKMISFITRCRQLAITPKVLTTKDIKSTKLERLKDILEEAKINGEKVLVFSPYTETLEVAKEELKEYKPKLVKGGMGSKVMDIVEEHENTKGFSVLLSQEKVLGVGYTLVNTSIVVFLSPAWTKASDDQMTDRLHRIGQTKTVQVIHLLLKDTVDELIWDILQGKGAMSKVTVDGVDKQELNKYFKRMNIIFDTGEDNLDKNTFQLLAN